MRNLAIKYYKMGLYDNKKLSLFVKRGFVSEEDFKELTGIEYQEIKAD